MTLADDVAVAVKRLRRSEDIGVSEAVNRLVREGLTKPEASAQYEHESYDIGLKIDVADIGEVLAVLDESV